jgi:hypothetical protein
MSRAERSIKTGGGLTHEVNMIKALKKAELFWIKSGSKVIVDPKNHETYPHGLSGNITDLSGNITDLSGNITDLSGNITDLSGNITDLRGDVSGISGDVSGLRGDADKCEITTMERKAGITITDLIAGL